MYRLGIDVGGTNTDCAILDEQLNCLGKTKSPTMADVSQGIDQAIKKILQQTNIAPEKIKVVMLGTTHCTNAIVQRKGLSRVGVIRLAKPATTAVEPLVGWPADLAEKIACQSFVAAGGYEYNGQEIAPIDEAEIRQACRKMKGVAAVAVVGVFSPVSSAQEKQVANIVQEELAVPVTLSSEIGSVGLLERENASILNAALTATIVQMIQGLKAALQRNGIQGAVYICQNDGTLMSLEKALSYPVLTIGCGPTNSIRGAAHLSQITDGLVVDVGGTTTDIGVLKNGFPRESSLATVIGGIRTNFRMPDVLSIGLGGGTLVKNSSEKIVVGPESLGYKILQESLSFGGTTLCTTDIAIANQDSHEVTGAVSQQLEPTFVAAVKEQIKELVEEAVDQMKTDSEPVPVILVGGGSIILPRSLSGVSQVVIPEHYDAANAIGAALGEVSGEINSVYSLEGVTQAEVVAQAEAAAQQEAVTAGAIPEALTTISIEVIPLAYLPKQAANVKVKVAGKLKLS